MSRPVEVWVKIASSLDGATATRAGESQWITSPEARARGRQLRGEVDAILVGVETVIADDPRLTARAPGLVDPVRVVLDSRARMSPDAALARTARDVPTVLVTTAQAPAEARQALEGQGVEVLTVENDAQGRVGVKAALSALASRGIGRVLVEGGGTVIGSFFDAKEVDRVVWFVAPTIIGGQGARRAVGGAGIAELVNAHRLERPIIERVGPDLLLLARVGR